MLWRAIRLAAGFVVAVLVGAGLLVGSSLLPRDTVYANITRSVATLSAEGNHHAIPWVFNTFVSDNYTDATMLNIAWIDPAPTGGVALPGTTTLGPVGTALAGAFHAGGIDQDPVRSLADRAATDGVSDTTYERYWHGYLPILRTLLTFASYAQIRSLLALALAALATGVGIGLVRRLGWGALVAFVIGGVAIAGPVIAVNVQFVGVFFIALTGMLAALHFAPRLERTDIELFAVLGAATSYIDFLTAPVVTLGLPLLVVLAAEARAALTDGADATAAATSPWRPWRRAIRASLAWGGGYALFWSAKWAINAAFLPPSSVGSVGQDLATRFGLTYGLVERVVAVAKNVANIVPFSRPADRPLGVELTGDLALYLGAFVVGTAVALIVAWFALRRMRGASGLPLRQTAALLAVGALPYLWYFVVANHSSIHNFYTFRAQVVTAFAVGLFFVYSLNWKPKRGEVHQRG